MRENLSSESESYLEEDSEGLPNEKKNNSDCIQEKLTGIDYGILEKIKNRILNKTDDLDNVEEKIYEGPIEKKNEEIEGINLENLNFEFSSLRSKTKEEVESEDDGERIPKKLCKKTEQEILEAEKFFGSEQRKQRIDLPIETSVVHGRKEFIDMFSDLDESENSLKEEETNFEVISNATTNCEKKKDSEVICLEETESEEDSSKEDECGFKEHFVSKVSKSEKLMIKQHFVKKKNENISSDKRSLKDGNFFSNLNDAHVKQIKTIRQNEEAFLKRSSPNSEEDKFENLFFTSDSKLGDINARKIECQSDEVSCSETSFHQMNSEFYENDCDKMKFKNKISKKKHELKDRFDLTSDVKKQNLLKNSNENVLNNDKKQILSSDMNEENEKPTNQQKKLFENAIQKQKPFFDSIIDPIEYVLIESELSDLDDSSLRSYNSTDTDMIEKKNKKNKKNYGKKFKKLNKSSIQKKLSFLKPKRSEFHSDVGVTFDDFKKKSVKNLNSFIDEYSKINNDKMKLCSNDSNMVKIIDDDYLPCINKLRSKPRKILLNKKIQ